ncbi:hypothetical protein XA68_13625 [Ophiocordyceps unilateralis]|uniref:EGF-like domain-containing protein n=1 Tax=Ophiocordyceps unilateralis TaxID=268505 RepID=A0A2A9PC14_OPHUN|nr:hypothetical protein XA68_13625 [Ophiocordyceps unilateralis]
MDRPLPIPGSVRRARERALAAQDALSAPPSAMADRPPRRPPDAKMAPGLGLMDMAHWPLPGPPAPAGMVPKGRGPISSDYSSLADSMASPLDSSSRRTTSSVGSIPDFPIPSGSFTFPVPPRRSALGPPPSSRRGMSSMYSNLSFVSPIPEESPRKESPRPRSHESYASSAAIPETWGTGSALPSPGESSDFFDDSVSDKSRDSTLEDFGDESKLFFEESPESKDHALPAPSKPPSGPMPPPPASLVPGGPFRNGTGYIETPTTSFINPPSVVSQASIPEGNSLTPDAILQAYAAASLSEPQPAANGPLSSNRFSYLRSQRPDTRTTDERGSMTSLPDLIRRATTLASMIDKGTRPGSRVGDPNMFAAAAAAPTSYSSANEKSTSVSMTATESRDGDSSLSDMLAAFPPPAQTPPRNENGSRDSLAAPNVWRSQSDPSGPSSSSRTLSPFSSQQRSDFGKKRGRRCCGMPLWLFLLLIFLLICIIVVAIVVPVELLVVRKRGNQNLKPDQNINDCRKFLKCLNGGTNVLSPGSCSCICTNGFTGSDCSIAGSQGCTSTNLVSQNGSTRIEDVTIGGALPRLIVDAEQTFGVPLSGAVIVGKVNEANLSCAGQNALVTFNGQSMAANAAQFQAEDDDEAAGLAAGKIPLGTDHYLQPRRARDDYHYDGPADSDGDEDNCRTQIHHYAPFHLAWRLYDDVDAPIGDAHNVVAHGGDLFDVDPHDADPFNVDQDRNFFHHHDHYRCLDLNFDRDLLHYDDDVHDVLEFGHSNTDGQVCQENVDAAETAQTSLRKFLSRTNSTVQEASDVDVGGRNRVNLDKFTVDVGQGPVGGNNTSQPP